MKFLRNENGQTLVLTALCMTAMLGFMALALDVGLLFRARRNMQTAADSAAIAGAQDYMWNASTTTARTQAKNASIANGYTDGASGAVVTVNIPPTSGPNTGSAGFVEAIVSQPVSTVFMGMFSRSSVNVSARAVAATPSGGTACIWLMAPSGPALDLQGKYIINAPNCGIYVNSNTDDAMSVTGNAGTVNATFLNVVGNSSLKHNTKPTSATMNAGTRKDPWGNLQGPDPATDCTAANTVTQATVTAANLKAPVNGVVCFGATNATLSAGLALPGGAVYVAENGVTIGGDMTIGTTSNGATLDVYAGTFNQKNSVLSINAPTSGTYNGIALMQPASNTNDLQVQFGSGNQVLSGYIYAPGAEVYLQDHGGGITATGIVAASMFDKASTINIPSYDAANPTTTPNRVITLVE
jgi:Flp pilus assembly protein TadG